METVKEAIVDGSKRWLKDTLTPFVIIGTIFNRLKTSITNKIDIILKKWN